jgi:hypothetical protein
MKPEPCIGCSALEEEEVSVIMQSAVDAPNNVV